MFIIAIGLATLIKGASMAYRSFNSPMSDPTKMHRFVIGLRIAVIGITMAGPGGRVELGHSVAVRPVSGLRGRGDCGVNRPPPHAPKGAESPGYGVAFCRQPRDDGTLRPQSKGLVACRSRLPCQRPDASHRLKMVMRHHLPPFDLTSTELLGRARRQAENYSPRNGLKKHCYFLRTKLVFV